MLAVCVRYLANDMQFFLFSPLFLFAFHWWRPLGATLAVLAVGACLAVSMNESIAYDVYSVNDFSRSLNWGDPSDLYIRCARQP